MIIIHLTASRFFGGPERQMLGLARAFGDAHETVFASFSEGGRCDDFLDKVASDRFRTVALKNDTPHLLAAQRELQTLVRETRAEVLICHGYKANLLGRVAARRCGIPAVAVSRGWTGESLKVRLYEAADRRMLRRMDRVVCVSHGQASKVRRAGVPPDRVVVIPNAVGPLRHEPSPNPQFQNELQGWFAQRPQQVIGAAGRLSPEKGFDILVQAAASVRSTKPSVGFVLFGDGRCRRRLERQIQTLGLQGAFVLAGFRADLDRFLPHFDVLALSSYTEGMPNIVLEAFSAAVPVVATAVGGTPELVDEGSSGYLVPPGDAAALAKSLLAALASEQRRRAMGDRGRARVVQDFTFAAQSRRYEALFAQLGSVGSSGRRNGT